MNHVERLSNLGTAYALVISGFNKDIDGIKDPKHKIEKQQDLDKIIHYFYKVTELMKDLNSWLAIFGPGAEE